MTNEFVMKSMSEATYSKKVGTASSYYLQEGSNMLPNRLSISKENITKVQRKGRNLQKVAGQCVGKFRNDEESPFKLHKPYTLRTQIWQIEEFLQFVGYGTCGISGDDGKIHDTGDLMVFYADDGEWHKIRIFIFKGMGRNPDDMIEAIKFASSLII